MNVDLDYFDITLMGDFNAHVGNEKDWVDFENLDGHLRDMEEEFANYLDTKRAMKILGIKLERVIQINYLGITMERNYRISVKVLDYEF